MIPVPKKIKAVECEDYVTISFISHACKITLNIRIRRLSKTEENMVINRTQFGFRGRCGTTKAIGMMRTLCDGSLKHDNNFT